MELGDAAARLEAATSANGFVDVASEILSASGLEDVELFAVGHEVNKLISLQPGNEVVDINDTIYEALANRGCASVAGSEWITLPTRQAPLLLARTSSLDHNFDRSIGALIGELYDLRRRQRYELERPRRRSAMSLAAELQWSLLPQMTDANSRVALAATLRPAYDVAGDAFDYQIDDEFVRAYALDAMGHGITAALSSLLVLTAIRNARFQGADLAAQLDASHSAVFDEWGGDRFVTAVAIESAPDRLIVVNAGHEPMRRRRLDGSVETLAVEADPPLGTPHTDHYRVTHLEPLKPGEGLALLSDGAPNNRSSGGVTLGATGVNEALTQCWAATPFETVYGFLTMINDLLDNDDVDDVTALVMEAL